VRRGAEGFHYVGGEHWSSCPLRERASRKTGAASSGTVHVCVWTATIERLEDLGMYVLFAGHRHRATTGRLDSKTACAWAFPFYNLGDATLDDELQFLDNDTAGAIICV
jgi:hypothetical protein